MIFRDRADAGRQLAAELTEYRGRNAVVIGLPRGGVEVAAEVARALQAELDVVLARKLGSPSQPELGIGALAQGGLLVLDQPTISELNVSPEEISRATEQAAEELGRRISLYRSEAPALRVAGRIAILVDDGLATGVTATAAARAIRIEGPAELVLAVPVCAPETAKTVAAEVDRVVCLAAPPDFRAVGLWYADFDQLTDEDVLRLLRAARGSEPGQQ